MKKIILMAAAFMMCAVCFAGTSAKEIVAGVYDFVTQKSESWNILDGKFSEIDLTSGQCIFKGSFVVKSLGYFRYEFDCQVSNKGDDIKVEVANMSSYACTKDGVEAKNARKAETSMLVSLQYADHMKTEIKKRIDDFNANGILEEKYSACITSPSFIYLYSQAQSELALKKFVQANVNGKDVELSFKLNSIDENNDVITGKPQKLAYRATGSVYVIKEEKVGGFNIYKEIPVMVEVLTNNDELLTAKIGDLYNAKGKVTYENIGTIWVYRIEEK